jgi:hypothetical protein
MVIVTLIKPWTDSHGVQHPTGSTVEVTQAQATDMRAQGYIADPEKKPGTFIH